MNALALTVSFLGLWLLVGSLFKLRARRRVQMRALGEGHFPQDFDPNFEGKQVPAVSKLLGPPVTFAYLDGKLLGEIVNVNFISGPKLLRDDVLVHDLEVGGPYWTENK